MLKLIVQHSPKLLAFVYGVHLHLHKPQWQHVLRLADALVVSEARHKTIASLYRLMVEAPDPSNGADTLRIKQNLENLRRNHYAPIRCGSPCVTCETNVMRLQGAKRCAPSKATFPIMRSRP